MRGGLYIVSIARGKIKENGYIKRGGVGISERKTAFSGCLGVFLWLHYLKRPRVGVRWAFGAVVSVVCVAVCLWRITCRTKQVKHICKHKRLAIASPALLSLCPAVAVARHCLGCCSAVLLLQCVRFASIALRLYPLRSVGRSSCLWCNGITPLFIV